jgi:hypothetical protein
MPFTGGKNKRLCRFRSSTGRSYAAYKIALIRDAAGYLFSAGSAPAIRPKEHGEARRSSRRSRSGSAEIHVRRRGPLGACNFAGGRRRSHYLFAGDEIVRDPLSHPRWALGNVAENSRKRRRAPKQPQ